MVRDSSAGRYGTQIVLETTILWVRGSPRVHVIGSPISKVIYVVIEYRRQTSPFSRKTGEKNEQATHRFYALMPIMSEAMKSAVLVVVIRNIISRLHEA